MACPTKDLAKLISQSTEQYPPIYAFMYRFAGPDGNATLGGEVDSVFGRKRLHSNFSYNAKLSSTMRSYWLQYAANYPIQSFIDASHWPVFTTNENHATQHDGQYLWCVCPPPSQIVLGAFPLNFPAT